MVTTYYFDFSKKGQDLFGNKDIPVIKDDQAIREAVYNLLLTPIGSVPMYPERGINIDRFLFEPIDDITASIMAYEIEKGLTTFEQRIKDVIVEVTPLYEDNGFVIDVSFAINFTSNRSKVQLKFSKIR